MTTATHEHSDGTGYCRGCGTTIGEEHHENCGLMLGAAVIVRGQVVAWFADFTEEAREWCTENHFGEWITWRAKAPEIVPLTEDEHEEVMRKAEELADKIRTPRTAP